MVGTKLGLYELLEEIGHGGMAVVYRAYQANIDRYVAIKIIQKNIFEQPKFLERFQREARVIARLEHPHILPVYDFDGSHEPAYIVMRYVDSGTLKELIRKRTLRYEEVSHLLRQTASALDYAHRQGILHRDIKPSNILLDREGNAVVADFGIARFMDSSADQSITQQGEAIGTPDYISPEQALGKSDVNRRADIYSLAVVTFEMLAGRLPFVAENSIQMTMKHIQEPAPLITTVQSSLPPALNPVMLRALAKDPDDRFETTVQFADEVIRALQVDSLAAPTQIDATKPITSITPTRTPTRKSQTTATEQQKQVTALHLSLGNFEEALLDAERDEEETAIILQPLRTQLEELITQHGGVVVERAGQMLLALWGLEVVREDDAEHAIRAALALRDVVQSEAAKHLPAGMELPAHFALNTGQVVLQLEAASGQFMPSGTVLNIVRQVEQVVEPGSILITYDTYRHVLGIFDVHLEPTVRIRGRKEAIELYKIIRARPRTFRLATRGIEGVATKMIGRDGELKLLQDSLMLTIEDREMQVVTCVGDAGVGKSRLLYEFNKWVDSIDQTVLLMQGRATQQSTQRPYALLRDLFSFRFQILDNDEPAVLRRKFEQGIAGFMGEGTLEKAQCIAHLIGFDMSDIPNIKEMLNNPASFRDKSLGYLNEFFKAMTSRAPVVLQMEDIHWADDPSLDLLSQLMGQNTNLAIVMICMARPELYERRATWGEGQPFHHRLNLTPLSKLDSRRLVREVLQKVENIPADLRDLIVDRADGNPFYVEEMIKVLIEDGVIIKTKPGADENAHWQIAADKLATVRVPVTLVGVLQARLDMLSPQEKIILQRAAVVGRIFWDSAVTLLSQTDDSTPAQVGAILEKLRAREFIYQRETSTFAGAREYVIRHAILRDVIYDSLLKRQQRLYHAATAEWLLDMSGGRVGEYSALIAEHFERAGEKLRAADYLVQTARQAFAISAYDQASNSIAHALRLVEGDSTSEAVSTRLRILIEDARIAIAKGLYPQAKKTLDEVLPLARAGTDKATLAESLTQAGFVAVRQGGYAEARHYLEEAAPIARALPVGPILVEVLRWLGVVFSYEGNYVEAQPPLEESLQLARSLNLNAAVAKALNALAGIDADQGNLENALTRYQEALAIARSSKDRYSVALIAQNIANINSEMKNFAEACRYAEESLAGAREIGSLSIAIWTLNVLSIAQIGMGDTEAAKASLNEGLRLSRSTGDIMRQLDNFTIYAELCAKTDPIAALEMIGLVLEGVQGAQDLIRETLRTAEKIRKMSPNLSEKDAQQAIARGKRLDREQMIRDLLGE